MSPQIVIIKGFIFIEIVSSNAYFFSIFVENS